MLSRRFIVATAPLMALFFTHALAAQTPTPTPTKKEETPKQKVETTWTVVKVGEDIQTIAADALKAKREQIKVDHAEALKAWKEREKAAKEQKLAFNEKKPAEVALKVIKDGFKTQADANAYLAKLQKEKDGDDDGDRS